MANSPDTLQQRLVASMAGMNREPPLPEALWPRVARARQRQLANRRAALGGSVALLVALLVVPFQFRGAGGPPDRATDATIAVADPVPANAAPDATATDPNAPLRILDRELQAAYQAGAGTDQIEALWQARADLEDARPTDLAVRPVRI